MSAGKTIALLLLGVLLLAVAALAHQRDEARAELTRLSAEHHAVVIELAALLEQCPAALAERDRTLGALCADADWNLVGCEELK